jgi:hypothetical protein
MNIAFGTEFAWRVLKGHRNSNYIKVQSANRWVVSKRKPVLLAAILLIRGVASLL